MLTHRGRVRPRILPGLWLGARLRFGNIGRVSGVAIVVSGVRDHILIGRRFHMVFRLWKRVQRVFLLGREWSTGCASDDRRGTLGFDRVNFLFRVMLRDMRGP